MESFDHSEDFNTPEKDYSEDVEDTIEEDDNNQEYKTPKFMLSEVARYDHYVMFSPGSSYLLPCARDLSLDGLYLADCIKLSVPACESVQVFSPCPLSTVEDVLLEVGAEVEQFLALGEAELEARLDVALWTGKVAAMGEVRLEESPYNMATLLGSHSTVQSVDVPRT